MRTYSRRMLIGMSLVLAVLCAAPVMSADTDAHPNAYIEYSRNPATLLISFSEVLPEFADQDPTPLVRIYGDGRVVVHLASYMKRAGQYEMLLSRSELEALLLELTPALLSFDAEDVKRQKQDLDDLVWDATAEWEDQVLFHVADAEFSVFHLSIDAYQSNGPEGLMVSRQMVDRSWRGLRFDVENYPELRSIEALMQAENALRALTERTELVRVESLP